MGKLAADLLGPVGLELARAVDQLPGEHAMPGGSRFELKWDGYRVGVVCRGGEVRLWSRNGKDFTAKFPDVQAALQAQLGTDCVLDGELVVWNGERLDFDALQQRMVNTVTTVRRKLAPAFPAAFVAFDVLAVGGVDVRPMRWTARRARLERLAQGWRPPLQVSPATADVEEAKEWLEAFKASGVEGLVVKGASSRYQPGRRDWVKVKFRETVDVIVGAVTGSVQRPEVLVVGRYRGRELEVIGRTTTLKAAQAEAVGRLLRPAGQRHPWPDEISTHWGRGSRTPIIKVQPKVVVEVAADAALQAGHYRHPLRLVRHRAELQTEDVPTLPDSAADE
ncbi:ATP dependent DNA ligase [Kribbella flavida DSM 17836]|uniref:ATP dependent DNA ligase n=1 Tax=Kribbella flavida (strain DSM 17836 / JCM 10339 / NBRC 14399) TaxID=479435 RepID=D2PLK1_KRIFD|nr:ATP-dependent DNA ligase [Kribbella flavida]ADB30630.1 ATP dependent DNA ligase [Kribbella flavida DSM 17836]